MHSSCMLHTFCLAAFIHHHVQHVQLAEANKSCIAPVAMQCTVKLLLKHPAAAAMASSTTSWAWRFPASTVCLLFVQCVASTNTRLSTCTCTCRPYLYTAIISAAVTVPFLLVKASIFDRPSYHPPAVFLFLDFLGFSLLHILVARKVVGWARNRYKLGLLGQSHPWQVGTLRCVMTNAQVPESVRPCVAWLMVTKHCVTLLQFLTL